MKVRRKQSVYLTIGLILAVICLIYGILVGALGSGGTKFFVVWIAIAVLLLLFCGILYTGAWDKIPHALKFTAGILFGIFLLTFLVTEGFIMSHMHESGEPDLDYIIVLGAQVHKDKPSIVLKYRLDKAASYLEENKNTVCIVSGGQGKNEPYAEAYGMAQYLMQKGIAEDRIILEDQSKTTEQNILNSKKFLQEGKTVGILTNDFHMFRALQIAKKCGLGDACGIAADSTKFYLPNNMLREYLAEIKFLLRSVAGKV